MIKHVVFLVALSASTFLPSVFGEQDNEAKAPALESAADKTAWINQVEQQLPLKLCDKDSYFLQCFSVSEIECQAISKHIVKSCLQAFEKDLPENLTVQDGENWGSTSGQCALDMYEQFMAHAKIKDCPKETSVPQPNTAP